ncbi:MAG: hypothetical protein Q8P41_06820 [Pseudomonadota bacterium]|nr:hypothetical protein [Pseudomonadota bacterium]
MGEGNLLVLLACAPDLGVPPAPEGVEAEVTAPVPSVAGPAAEGPAAEGPCGGVPVLTWDTFGQGFLIENCQGCHASGAPERYGAPDDVTFDTVEDAWRWSGRILERVGAGSVDEVTMPPMGGVSADDRTRLRWWLACGAGGT